jgi:hypothetical protein
VELRKFIQIIVFCCFAKQGGWVWVRL